MLSTKLLPVSMLAFVLVTACGSKDDNHKDETPAAHPQIPLNSPADILGSWKSCVVTATAKSSSGTYTFSADGSLELKSETFNTVDCSGATSSSITFKGTYVVGAENALDMSFPKFDTVYRVFSVQGNTLLISNNAGPGADPLHRDYDLNTDPLKLTKLAQ